VHVLGGGDGARSHRRNWFLFDSNLLAVGCLRSLLWIGFHSSGRLTPSRMNSTPSRTRLKSCHAASEKASRAGHTPGGAGGTAFYRDGTCGTGGAGAFLRVSRKLPVGSTVCRTGAGGCAGLRVPGSLHAGRVRERQQSRRTAGTHDGTDQSAG
jgi:hypothetical protein